MPDYSRISSSIRNPGDFVHSLNGNYGYEQTQSKVQPKSNYQHSEFDFLSF